MRLQMLTRCSAPCGSCSWSGFPSTAVASGALRQIHVKGGSELSAGERATGMAPGCTVVHTDSRLSAAQHYSYGQSDCKGNEYGDKFQCVMVRPGDVIGRPGRCLSCSDKISRWLICGVQGALLSHFLERPILLTTVVIGRKYVDTRCALALGVSSCMHTKVYGTSVKLEHCKSGDAGEREHNGTDGGRGTQGDGDECLSWAEGDQLVGRHDGRTGCDLSPAGGRSNVCRAELFKLFARACAQCGTQRGSWLRVNLSNDEIGSAHEKSSSSAFNPSFALKSGSGHTLGSTGDAPSQDCTDSLEMESYDAVKRAAPAWYNAARCLWLSQSGLITLGA